MSCVAKRTRSHTQKSVVAKRSKVDLIGRKNERTKTILQLNDDCLEEVFLYLSDTDLVNVSEANKRFKVASERAFTRNYGKIRTTVSNVQFNRVSGPAIKKSVKLLETFGHLIMKLVIEFKLEKVEHLLEAVDHYCCEKINELEFRHIGVRVKEPSILYDIGLQTMDFLLLKLNERFPNLNSLKFDYRSKSKNCPYFGSIARPIPNLKSLSVVGPLFAPDDIHTFIDANAQLESFTIIGEHDGFIGTPRSFYLTDEFIQYLDASLPQLKRLEIDRISIENIPMLADYPNRFQNLRKFTFGTFPNTMHPERGYLSFLGENIEEITLLTYDFDISTFAKNISRFKKLKRLVLHLTTSMEVQGEFHTFFEQSEILVWSPRGIRKLISSNNQLTEIVIQRYRVRSTFLDHIREKEYLAWIGSKINGAQWTMKVVAKCFVFSKQTKNY